MMRRTLVITVIKVALGQIWIGMKKMTRNVWNCWTLITRTTNEERYLAHRDDNASFSSFLSLSLCPQTICVIDFPCECIVLVSLTFAFNVIDIVYLSRFLELTDNDLQALKSVYMPNALGQSTVA